MNETGITAARALGPNDGDIMGAPDGVRDRFMVGRGDSGGGFALVEHLMAPKALAAPLHLHTRELHPDLPNDVAPAYPESMAEVTPMIVALDDLPGSGGARRFIGAEHGGVPVSIIVIEAAPGSPPTRLHRHPYPEIWVVEAGEARFTVGGRELEVNEGNILIGPAEVPHRFTNGGPRPLRIISIHPAARFLIQDVSD